MSTRSEPPRQRSSLWYIGRLAAYRPGLFLLCAGLVTFTYLAPVIPPLIAQALVDRLSGQAHVGLNAPTLIAAWLAWGLVNAGAHVMQHVQETTQEVVSGLLIRRNVFEDVLNRPGARALSLPGGEALTRFRSDVDAITETLMWSYDPIGQGLTTLVALGVLWFVSPSITAIVVLPLCVVVAAVNVASRNIKRFRHRRQETTGEVTGLVSEIFSAVGPIKIGGAEQRAAARLTELNLRRRDATLQDVLLTKVLASISGNAAYLSSGAILLLLTAQMRSGEFTAGDFLLFSSYMAFVSLLIANFGEVLTKFRQTGVSVERLLGVAPGNPPEALVRHDKHPVKDVLLDGHRPDRSGDDQLLALTATGLTFRYPGSGRGIENVSLHLERGTFTVVTGRVGAGKTTLLRTLLGLLPTQAGTVAWNGREVPDLAAFMVPPRCAYTPQVPKLFSDTLRNNILLGKQLTAADLDAAVHAAVLEHDVGELEDGLDAVIGTGGVKLSGGQMQRTAAARMFAGNADLLVVDDVSSALDVETEMLLWQRLMSSVDVTCLVVSHRPTALRHADTVILLEEGRVADRGPLPDLLDRSGLMRELWDGTP